MIYSIKDKKWKLADFGCVEKFDPDNLYEVHTVTGTPSYMSPELYFLY